VGKKQYLIFFILSYLFLLLLGIRDLPRNSQNFDYFLENIILNGHTTSQSERYLYSDCFEILSPCESNQPLFRLDSNVSLSEGVQRDARIYYIFLEKFLTDKLMSSTIILFSIICLISVLIQTFTLIFLSDYFKRVYLLMFPILYLFIDLVRATASIAPIGISLWLSVGSLLIYADNYIKPKIRKNILFSYLGLLFLIRIDQFIITIIALTLFTKLQKIGYKKLSKNIAIVLPLFFLGLQLSEQKIEMVVDLFSTLVNIGIDNINSELLKIYYYLSADIYPPDYFDYSNDTYYNSATYLIMIFIFITIFTYLLISIRKSLNLFLAYQIIYLFIMFNTIVLLYSDKIRIELRYVQPLLVAFIMLISINLSKLNHFSRHNVLFSLSSIHFICYMIISQISFDFQSYKFGQIQIYLIVPIILTYVILMTYLRLLSRIQIINDKQIN
jgi:hypothetical protein